MLWEIESALAVKAERVPRDRFPFHRQDAKSVLHIHNLAPLCSVDGSP